MLTTMQRDFARNARLHRWNVKSGATGSGKTFMDVLYQIPRRIMDCRGEGLIVLLGNTRSTLARNVLDPMRSIWGEKLVGSIRADGTVTLFGKKCYALGADNKKHVKSLQGTTIEYAYGDEVTTWNEAVFSMLKSRLRCAHSHFDGTCNPDGPNHWFKRFLDSDADVFCQHYTIDDNPHLPLEQVAQLKREYAGTVYYDRFIEGRWVAAEGAIYRPLCDDPARFLIDAAPQEIAVVRIGVDFGSGRPSANAFCATGFTRGFGQLVTLEEYYNQAAITPAELERDFAEFVRMLLAKGYGKSFEVFADSAEQTLIAGLRACAGREKLPVTIRNARKGPINDRIRFLLRMMATDRYRIVRHNVHTLDALRSAVWDDRAVNRDVRLDDGQHNIDSLDSMEYSFEGFMRAMTAIG